MKFILEKPFGRTTVPFYRCGKQRRQESSEMDWVLDSVLGSAPPMEIFTSFLFPEEVKGRRCCHPALRRQKPQRPEKWSALVKIPEFFDEEDVTFEVTDKTVLITAVKTSEDQDSGADRVESRRKVNLPDSVNKETIKLEKKNGRIFLTAAWAEPEKKEDQEKTGESDENRIEKSKARNGEVMEISEKKPFEVVIDPCGISPKNLSVRQEGDRLLVSGREERQEGGVYSCQQFSRVFSLPPHIDTDMLHSALTDQGQLRVTAPVLHTDPTRDIPIDTAPAAAKESDEKSDTVRESNLDVEMK